MALLSLLLPPVAAARDEEQHVAACLTVNGLAVNVRAGRGRMGDNGRSHDAVFHPDAC